MPENEKTLLPTLIEKSTNQKKAFSELLPSEQIKVLDYIKQHNIAMRVFKHKWYDVLSNKFYAIEYLLDYEAASGIQEIKREFDSFKEFFDYVQGDIYDGSCFYGYAFSDEEINSFGIDIKLVNFDSFVNETIDSYTFGSINQTKNEKTASDIDKVKAMIEWIDGIKPISTFSDLEFEYKRFSKTFDAFGYVRAFFSMLLRKNKETIRKAAIRFACKHDIYDGLTFGDILLKYGKKDALTVIDNFNAPCSYQTRLKRIRTFKEALKKYGNGELTLQRMLGFDDCRQLYYIENRYCDNQRYLISSCEYFTTFSEFVTFLNDDLSDANLSNAPISKEQLEGFKINEHTKFPVSKEYKVYKIEKTFDGGKFIVNQKWLDTDGTIILSDRHAFEHFFDFVHFLKGDLSNVNLIMCDGIENIAKLSNLKLDGIKVRSDVANKLKIPFCHLPNNSFECKEFESTKTFELQTTDNLLMERPDDNDYSNCVSYITDIHLSHRLKAYNCKSPEDVDYVIKTIATTLGEQATEVNLIGGDTSSDLSIFRLFISNLKQCCKTKDFFFVLGNHEFWALCDETPSTIVERYTQVLKEDGLGTMHLVQNNIFYLDDRWKEISEKELIRISPADLRKKTRSAKIIIFGGIGFAGMNEEFNADCEIYKNALDRNGEKQESTKFLALYEKVTTTLAGKNLVVLTHMPMKDWGGKSMTAKDGVIYVHGHNHRNYFFDDGKKRIYADNQVGYRGKRVSFKKLFLNFDYDWFADYDDGIHEISKDDYQTFYRGIGEIVTINRQFEKLFMIKRSGTYMFLMQSLKGKMSILNGGAIRNVGSHSLEYFYANLANYSKSVSMYLSNYETFQKRVSDEVKKIGGLGRIHGSIVDIDFFNHLYLNPLDGSITPYFAYSMVDKYVYRNLLSLLKCRCPSLYENYKKLIGQSSDENALVAFGNDLVISSEEQYVDSTQMYKVSRILKGLQFTTKYNIVRLWNDAIVNNASEENGRLMVSGIIDHDLVSQVTKNGSFSQTPQDESDESKLSTEER